MNTQAHLYLNILDRQGLNQIISPQSSTTSPSGRAKAQIPKFPIFMFLYGSQSSTKYFPSALMWNVSLSSSMHSQSSCVFVNQIMLLCTYTVFKQDAFITFPRTERLSCSVWSGDIFISHTTKCSSIAEMWLVRQPMHILEFSCEYMSRKVWFAIISVFFFVIIQRAEVQQTMSSRRKLIKSIFLWYSCSE